MSVVQCALDRSSAVITANSPTAFTVTVVNTSDAIDAYEVSVFGMDARWVEVSPARPTLFPGESAEVTIRLVLPESFPAGTRQCTVYVASHNRREDFRALPLTLSVDARTLVTLTLDPATVNGRRRAQFGLVVQNHGNGIAEIEPQAIDPEDLATVHFEPPLLQLLPQQQALIKAHVSARQPWVGSPKARVLTFQSAPQITDDDPPASATGTFVQRARIGRLVFSLLGLLTAAAVFAAVLSHAFRNVVDEAKVDERVVNEALAKGGAAGSAVSVRPATINGSVLSVSTGSGIAGVQVQLFRSDNGSVAVGSAATGDDGTFAFARLNKGTYRVRLSGAGFGVQWYPSAQSFADATDVEVDTGATVSLDVVALSGQPGSVEGTVIADDPVGAIATLVIPGRTDPNVPAVVATARVGADGSFALANVPTPGDYELIVTQEGRGTASRPLSLAPAEQVTGLTIALGAGDGVVTGHITAAGSPLGGVKIDASNGTQTLSTVSLTDGDVGFFALRGLATPARYTLTISKDGYRVESRTVTLGDNGAVVDVALASATGAISGHVVGPGGLPLGGVKVDVTGGPSPVITSTISDGAQTGQWSLSGVESPGSYTVTFSKAGYVSQTRRVTLDDSVAGGQATGIDAALAPSTATVAGMVLDADNVPVAHATITLSGGDLHRVMSSADSPAGAFSFSGVQPGSYTISADRTGSVSVVQVVTVRPGETANYTLQLGRQASFVGLVTDNGFPADGIIVRLYAPAAFPGTPAAALASTVTANDGSFAFPALEAPKDFVVAVYDPGAPGDALDSQLVSSVPGTEITVPVFEIGLV